MISALAFLPAFGGEYPVVVNNFDVEPEGIDDVTGSRLDNVVYGEYYLYRNQLKSLSFLDGSIEFDPLVPEADLPDTTFSPGHTQYNGTPRNFVVGTYDDVRQKFICSGCKFVNPALENNGRNRRLIPFFDRGDDPYGPRNMYQIFEFPFEVREKSEQAREKWDNMGAKWHFKLDAPLPVELLTETEPDTLSLEPGEKLVQGIYELGGAVVCGRNESGVLALYRFSCSQRTHPNAIQVFNPDEKLVWDAGRSDVKAHAAFLHLRQDLLEHNTGLTENRLFVRMKPYTVKLDKPGATKALRDWYLLAPFYDPVTQSYRETLTRADFAADAGAGFDPAAANFDPAVYVKKLVPYTLPDGYWDQ